jgi:hypothetical protein
MQLHLHCSGDAKHASMLPHVIRGDAERSSSSLSLESVDRDASLLPGGIRGDADASIDGAGPAADSGKSAVFAGLGVLLGLGLLLGGGVAFKDQIAAFLRFFIGIVDDYGAWGYVLYGAVYTVRCAHYCNGNAWSAAGS